MESLREEDVSSNIPHMHLFIYLKRKFPELKDPDITDSIQRFGLDQSRCEDELNKKCQDQHRGYYSPWNRSRASSQGSPLSPETHSHASSPLQNCSSPPTPFTSQPQFPPSSPRPLEDSSNGDRSHPIPHQLYALSIGCSSHLPSSTVDPSKGIVYSCATTKSQVSTTTSSYYYRNRISPSLAGHRGEVPDHNGFSYCEPASAPILLKNSEPSFDAPVMNRRRSADTLTERQRFWGSTCRDPDDLREQDTLRETSNCGFSVNNPTMNPPPNSSAFNARTNMTSAHSGAPRGVSSPHEQQQPFPAAIQEQQRRKERLREELTRRMEEKEKLEDEVKDLAQKIETKENMQRLLVLNSKKEIELIQQENSKLQYVCDEMEREILASGEVPRTDQRGRLPPADLPSFRASPHRVAPQPPLPRANSTSSLSSGGGATPSTPLVPSRKAPSPPFNPPPSQDASMNRPGADVASPRPATIGSDENGKEWSCSKCTFKNSPFLNECEICSFPHFSLVREI